MEGLLTLLGLGIVAGVLVIPIIILSKMGSTSSSLFRLEQQLRKLQQDVATKQDLQSLQERMHFSDVPEPHATGEELQPQPTAMKPEPVVVPAPVIEEVITQVEKPTIESTEVILQPAEPAIEIEPVFVEPELVAEPVLEQPIVEEPTLEPVLEETYVAMDQEKEPIVTSQPIEEPVMVAPIYPPTKPITPMVEEKNFIERLLNENLLSKIGILTLVLGIGFFVKYAIDKDWINEIGRVGIGLLAGAIVIGIAYKLKEKYKVFSSILSGGGISIFYITITLAFREYELFSQPVAFGLLIAVTIFAVLLSIMYDQKELAIFSLLGGFASPLMISTGNGNYIVLFSYILILNTGMLLISFWKRWTVIGVISYLLTLIFFWSWVFISFKSEQMKGALIFASLFFVQFYALALIDHFKSKTGKITAYQVILILTCNISLFFACSYLTSSLTFNVRGIAAIAIAVVNSIVMLLLLKRSQVDRNLVYTIIGVVLSFISLAIPIQLNGYAITMFWAAEAVILLWLWQKSEIVLFKVSFLIIGLLVIVSYIMDLANMYLYTSIELPIAFNKIFMTGLVLVVCSIIVSYLLRKEDKNANMGTINSPICSVLSVIACVTAFIFILSFFVPFLELNHHLIFRADLDFSSSFRYLTLVTYTTVYFAIISIIYRNRPKNRKALYILFCACVALFTVFFTYFATQLREDIYYVGIYSSTYFLVHFLAILAVAVIMVFLVRNTKEVVSESKYTFIATVLVFLSVVVLSVEADNIGTMIFANQNNYDQVLHDIATFVYPILWGVVAMVLMIWGLRSKEVILRKISLAFFGLIILKFYAYDVWRMSQIGLIISFIALSIILLLVSFLQQRIRVLVKDETKEETVPEEEVKGVLDTHVIDEDELN